MGRYTRGKTTIHLFFLNDHMISLTTTITMSISPQKLKQQVVYWLHLASVMRRIPSPITPKADTSCMFKKKRENAVHRVGHLSLCFMERNKTMMRLPQKCLAADFLEIFIVTYFQCSCRALIFCTILLLPNLYTVFRIPLWGRELLLYLLNKWREERQPEVHLLQLTLLWCPVLQKSFA